MADDNGKTRITVALDSKVLERLDNLAAGYGMARPAMLTVLINKRYEEVYGDDGFLCV